MANIAKSGGRIAIGNANVTGAREASMVRLQNGNLAVVYTADGPAAQNIYIQQITPQGVVGAIRLVTGPDAGVDTVGNAEACLLTDGTVGVVFKEAGAGLTTASFVAFNTVTGTPGAATLIGDMQLGRNPDIAALPGGGAVFSLFTPLSGGVASFQASVGNSFVVALNRTGGSENSVARLDNGFYAVSGHGTGTPPTGAAFASIFNVSGTEVIPFVAALDDGVFAPNPSDYSTPDVHALSSGGTGHFLTTWTFFNQDDGTEAYGFSVVDDSGELIAAPDPYAASDLSLGSLIAGDVARLPNGGFVLSWMDPSLNSFVQAFDAIGCAYGPPLQVNVLPGLQVYKPSIFETNGAIFVAFAEGQLGRMAVQKLALTEIAAPIYGSNASQTLNGTGAGDIMFAENGNDTVNGGNGNDHLYGGLGNDVISDGTGNDTAHGGGGNDRFVVGSGTDAYDGGTGTDILDFRASSTGAVLGFGEVPNGPDNFFSIETIYGSNSAGDRMQLALDGLRAHGFAGNDLLTGGFGGQLLSGGTGLDFITGGDGRDILEGGADADTFDYNNIVDSTLALTGRDLITDFNANAADRLNLATIDAIAGGANNAFVFLATQNAAFTGLGQLRWFQSGGNTFVEANTTGSLAADMRIELAALVSLDRADFVL